MIGAFYQPRAGARRHGDARRRCRRASWRAGLAEVIKHGADPRRGVLRVAGGEHRARWSRATPRRCATRCGARARSRPQVVARDERETGAARAAQPRPHLRPRDRGRAGLRHLAARRGGGGRHGDGGRPVAAARDRSTRPTSSACAALLERAGLPVAGPHLGVDRYLELMAARQEGRRRQAARFILLERHRRRPSFAADVRAARACAAPLRRSRPPGLPSPPDRAPTRRLARGRCRTAG